MPGSGAPVRPQPERPKRIPTFSRDRLCLATVSFILFPLGMLFVSVSLLSMFQLMRIKLARVGIILPLPYPPPNLQTDFWDSPWRTIAHLLFTSLFLVVGLRMMYVVVVTIDRIRNSVVVRSGCLGLFAKRRKLADFNRVQIRQGFYFSRVTAPLFDRSKDFDIVLAGDEPPEMPIALVTLSLALAREVAEEVRAFTRLKLEDIGG